MKRRAILLGMIVILSAAMAYDPLYIEDNAMLLDHLQLRVGAAVNYGSSSALFDSEGDKQDFSGDYSMTNMYIPIRLGIGLMNIVDVQFLIPFMSLKYSNGTEMKGSGIADSWFTAKAGVNKSNMYFAGRLGILLPTGDDEPEAGDLATGSGRSDLDIGALFCYRPESITGFGADVNLGYRMKPEKDDYNAGDALQFDIKAGYQITDVLFPYAVLDGQIGLGNAKSGDTEIEDSAVNLFSMGVGAVFQTDMGFGVHGNILYDIAGKNHYAGMDINVGVEYTPQLGN